MARFIVPCTGGFTWLQVVVVYRFSKTYRVHPWPKTKLRKLTERQRKQRFGHGWTRIHTDADCRLPRAGQGEDWNQIVWLYFGETLYYDHVSQLQKGLVTYSVIVTAPGGSDR